MRGAATNLVRSNPANALPDPLQGLWLVRSQQVRQTVVARTGAAHRDILHYWGICLMNDMGSSSV